MVKAFGDTVEGVRIEKTAPKISNQPAPKCHDCEKDIVACSGMTSEQVAQYTKSKYDVAVCAACGAKRKEAASVEQTETAESEVKQNDTAQPE